MLKGLHTGTSCEEILEELNGLNIENVNILKVTPLRMRSKKGNTNNNASTFIVQISADSKNSNLTNIHSLIHHVVKWEHLRKDIIAQCKKCQRTGHVASNCDMEFRCVKCAEKHNAGACNLGKNIDKSLLYCVNCNQFGHPASYKGCSYIIKQVEANTRQIKDASTPSPGSTAPPPGSQQKGKSNQRFQSYESAANNSQNLPANTDNSSLQLGNILGKFKLDIFQFIENQNKILK